MEGRVFDAQVVLSPKDSPLGKVLSEYVCVRVVRMDDVNIGLFDRDWNNAIYFFVLNADGEVIRRGSGLPRKADIIAALGEAVRS